MGKEDKMKKPTEDDNFNWVEARNNCSMAKEFEALKQTVEANVSKQGKSNTAQIHQQGYILKVIQKMNFWPGGAKQALCFPLKTTESTLEIDVQVSTEVGKKVSCSSYWI